MNISRVIAAIALLVITIAIIAFAVMNPSEDVRINLGWVAYEAVPMILALFVAFIIGIGLTILYCLYYFIDMGLNIRRLKKRNKDLENELVALRNLPLEESPEESEPPEGKEVES
jgi:uncharacterized integral membrane protein